MLEHRKEAEGSMVVIVDDNPSVLKVMRASLMATGFDVVAIDTSKGDIDVVEKIMSVPEVKCILLDYMMPEKDGIDIFHELRDKRGNPYPVIMLTGMGSQNVAIQFLKAGGSDYVEKPPEYNVLTTKILMAIENWKFRKHAIQERVAREIAEKMERYKTDMINFLVHSLKSPLNSASGFVSIALKHLDNNPNKSKTLMEKARDVFPVMHRRIEDFLYLINIEEGKFDLPIALVNMADLLTEITERNQSAFEERGAYLYFDKWEDFPELLVSREAIAITVENLVHNALKFMKDGGETRIVLSREEGGSDIKILVYDDGVGIPEDKLEEIFQPFKRAHSVGEGSGLGLAICKKIIEAHKGRIWAENLNSGSGGGGVVFSFTIPVPSSSSIEQEGGNELREQLGGNI